MLERIQDRSLLHRFNPESPFALYGASKALAEWAIVDDYDHILDLSCGSGKLLHYLSQKYCLRACGIAESPEQARALHDMLPEAEVLSASKENMPWRSNAFNTVFYQMDAVDPAERGDFLQEIVRVLKPGGQVLISLHALPDLVGSIARAMGFSDDKSTKHTKLLHWMEAAGLSDVSWRATGPMTGIAMGWKNKEIGGCPA